MLQSLSSCLKTLQNQQNLWKYNHFYSKYDNIYLNGAYMFLWFQRLAKSNRHTPETHNKDYLRELRNVQSLCETNSVTIICHPIPTKTEWMTYNIPQTVNRTLSKQLPWNVTVASPHAMTAAKYPCLRGIWLSNRFKNILVTTSNSVETIILQPRGAVNDD